MLSKKGQATIEYALMLAVVIGAVLAVLQTKLQPAMTGKYGDVADKIRTQSEKLSNTFNDDGTAKEANSYGAHAQPFIDSGDPLTVRAHTAPAGAAGFATSRPDWGEGGQGTPGGKDLIMQAVQESINNIENPQE